jgi:hypothetical protein
MLVSAIAIAAVSLSMFSGWEMGGESWGYWYFARVFAETGNFIVTDRSPLYILFLNLFTWLPYPASITVEYLVTTSITVIVLVVFFRPYLGIWLALLAACLWIPYLQQSEPPVQKLALVCSLVAILLRNKKADRLHLTASYAFLIFAYLFRQTYILLIFVFLAYDMLRAMQEGKIKEWFSWRPRLTSDWPIILVVGLFLWFLSSQSPSLWNNVWFASTEWFPTDGKSMSTAGVQAFNWVYILLKYGTFEGHDFYFTNQEAFGGAKSMLGAIVANPQLCFEIIIDNLKSLGPVMMGAILLPKTGIVFIDYLFKFCLLVGVIYGAFRASRDWPTKSLLVGSFVLVGITVISIPKVRYMVPMIPIYVMAASWYGSILTSFLKKSYPNTVQFRHNMAIAIFVFGIFLLMAYFISPSPITSAMGMPLFMGIVVAVFFAGMLLFSVAESANKGFLLVKIPLKAEVGRFALALPTMLLLWWFCNINTQTLVTIAHNAASDVDRNQLRLLESREDFVKHAYPTLAQLTQSCRGVMALESTFFGAFMDIPQSRVFDIWEIPPFGRLNNSPYGGLNPSRINCIFVSPSLETSVGSATNIQMRYQNYIKPYISQLQSLGAFTYEIKNYGYAVILQ